MKEKAAYSLKHELWQIKLITNSDFVLYPHPLTEKIVEGRLLVKEITWDDINVWYVCLNVKTAWWLYTDVRSINQYVIQLPVWLTVRQTCTIGEWESNITHSLTRSPTRSLTVLSDGPMVPLVLIVKMAYVLLYFFSCINNNEFVWEQSSGNENHASVGLPDSFPE